MQIALVQAAVIFLKFPFLIILNNLNIALYF